MLSQIDLCRTVYNLVIIGMVSLLSGSAPARVAPQKNEEKILPYKDFTLNIFRKIHDSRFVDSMNVFLTGRLLVSDVRMELYLQ